jgi:hypothetical protein
VAVRASWERDVWREEQVVVNVKDVGGVVFRGWFDFLLFNVQNIPHASLFSSGASEADNCPNAHDESDSDAHNKPEVLQHHRDDQNQVDKT